MCNCDSTNIMKKLGFRNSHVFETFKKFKHFRVICQHPLCTNNSYTPAYLEIHNIICHTEVEGSKRWKCPFYEDCKFAISEDLLKYESGNEI